MIDTTKLFEYKLDLERQLLNAVNEHYQLPEDEMEEDIKEVLLNLDELYLTFKMEYKDELNHYYKVERACSFAVLLNKR